MLSHFLSPAKQYLYYPAYHNGLRDFFLCPFLNVNILLKNDIIFYVLNIRLYNEMIDICADTTLREVDVNADYKEGIGLL